MTLLRSSSPSAPRYGLIGYPVSHSVSPAIFRAALASCGIQATYDGVAVPPDALASELRRLTNEGYLGLNVTVPHKTAVIPLLDRLDDSAADAGAVNVLSATEGGLVGFNTDTDGFAESLGHLGVPDLEGATVLLLGAGGAARAVLLALLRFRAGRVLVVNRSRRRAEELMGSLSPRAGGTAMEAVDTVSLPSRPDLFACRLLVQATSLGLRETDPLPIDPGILPEGCFVYDLVYGPRSTSLVRQAAARGLPAADGREMLLRQAMEAFRIWFARPAPVSAMRDAMEAALTARQGAAPEGRKGKGTHEG